MVPRRPSSEFGHEPYPINAATRFFHPCSQPERFACILAALRRPGDSAIIRPEANQIVSIPKRLRHGLLLGLLLLGGRLSTGTLPAQQQPKPKTPGNDWIQLFNEKDLTGWNKIGAESWTVEGDGILHGRGLTKAYGYLETDKPYKNFQMSLRFKCVGDGNSGIFFHTGFKGVDATQGMQFEIDCTMMHHTAGVYAEDGRGWVVWPSPENEGVVRKGEWNDYFVEVIGNRYRSRLNGVQMVDFTDPKPGAPDGTIALQLHAGGEGNMQFKDIWIRDLSNR